jgi:hypothetical protein
MSYRTATSWSWCRWLVGDNANQRSSIRNACTSLKMSISTTRALRDLPVFGLTCYLEFMIRRFDCEHCGDPFTEHLGSVRSGRMTRYSQKESNGCSRSHRPPQSRWLENVDRSRCTLE